VKVVVYVLGSRYYDCATCLLSEARRRRIVLTFIAFITTRRGGE
jgi:hypothetical protein